MKSTQDYIISVLSAACVVLSLVAISYGNTNNHLQHALQQSQGQHQVEPFQQALLSQQRPDQDQQVQLQSEQFQQLLSLLKQSQEQQVKLQSLQHRKQQMEEEINRGNQSVQISQNILRDLAELSLRNGRIKQILTKNGYTVNANASTPTSK